MAGFDYGRMQGVATRLLTRFNQGVVTLTRPGTQTPGDESWDPPIESDPQVFTLQATVKGVSKEFIDGTTILTTDLEVTAAEFGDDPSPADVMTIDGQAVTIVQTKRIPAAGVLVALKFVVRA